MSSGRQAWLGRACRQFRESGLLSVPIVMLCVSQSRTSARCQPTGLPQWVRCFGNRPRAAKPRSSQRGRRVRREISLALRIARRSGSGSLTQRGRRTSCDVRAIAISTEWSSLGDRVSMFLPHQGALMETRMLRQRAKSSARIQGRHGLNTTRILAAHGSRNGFPGESPEKIGGGVSAPMVSGECQGARRVVRSRPRASRLSAGPCWLACDARRASPRHVANR